MELAKLDNKLDKLNKELDLGPRYLKYLIA